MSNLVRKLRNAGVDLAEEAADFIEAMEAENAGLTALVGSVEAAGFQRGLREAWRIARARADAFADDTAVFGPGTPSDMAVSIDTALRGACEPAIPFDGWTPPAIAEKEGQGNG